MHGGSGLRAEVNNLLSLGAASVEPMPSSWKEVSLRQLSAVTPERSWRPEVHDTLALRRLCVRKEVANPCPF